MRTKHKVDINQAEIVAWLRQISGVTVSITSMVGHGFPDIVVGYQGNTYLYEIKQDGKKKLTPDEQTWFDGWTGHAKVITCGEDVLDDLGIEHFY